MSYSLRRAIHGVLICAALLLAISVAYRRVIIGKLQAAPQFAAEMTFIKMLLTRTNVMHYKPVEDGWVTTEAHTHPRSTYTGSHQVAFYMSTVPAISNLA